MRWLALAPIAAVFAACGDAYQDATPAPDAGAADASTPFDAGAGNDAGDPGKVDPGTTDDGGAHGGALDPTFGVGGKMKLPSAATFTLLADGGLFLVHSGGAVAPTVEKRSAGGTVDSSWGDAGTASAPTAPKMVPYWSAAAPDGGFLIEGLTDNYDVHVLRYKTGGVFDTTFGGTGYVEVKASSHLTYNPLCVAVSPAGRVLYAAEGYDSQSDAFSIVVGQLLENGKPDPAFVAPLPPANGRVTWHAFAWTPSGRTLAAGDVANDDSVFTALLDEKGSNARPAFLAQWGLTLSHVDAIAPFGDAGALVFGFSSKDDFKTSGLAVARYGEDGKLDPKFGTGGFTVKRLGTATARGDRLTAGAIDAAGRVVATGYVDGQLVVVRFTKTGAFDPAFGTDGVVKLDLMNAYGPQLTILPSGTIVVAAGDNVNDQSTYLYRVLP